MTSNILEFLSQYLPDLIERTPAGWHTKGSLRLAGASVTHLPSRLTVEGTLDLSGTNIADLPEHLTVRGDLDLRRTSVHRLPASLRVEGRIHTDRCVQACASLQRCAQQLSATHTSSHMCQQMQGGQP